MDEAETRLQADRAKEAQAKGAGTAAGALQHHYSSLYVGLHRLVVNFEPISSMQAVLKTLGASMVRLRRRNHQ